MTWSINLDVKDGKISPEGVRIGGTPPDGQLAVNGYENEQGRGVGVNTGGMYGSFYAAAPALAPAGGTVVDAGQLARAAYAAYGDRIEGAPMPAWEDLGDAMRDAWTGATVAVVNRVHKQEET